MVQRSSILLLAALALLLVSLVDLRPPGGTAFVLDRPAAVQPDPHAFYDLDPRALWLTPAPSLRVAGWALFGAVLVALGLARPANPARALLLTALGLLAWATLLEAARLTWPEPPFVGATSVSWRLKPDLKQPQPVPSPRTDARGVPLFRLEEVMFSNSQGLREREVPLRKEPGELRVFCVGHSGTFGWGVAAEEAWPRRLEGLLAAEAPTRKLTVLNGGMPGHTPLQQYLMLREVGLRYDPDLVVIGGMHRGRDLPEANRNPLGTSVAWTLLREAALSLKPPAQQEGASRYAVRIQELLAAHGIPGVAFNVPQRRDGGRFAPGDAWLQGTLGLRSTTNFRVVQILIPADERDRFPIPDETWERDPHPSVFGHESIARGVAEVIRNLPAWQAWRRWSGETVTP